MIRPGVAAPALASRMGSEILLERGGVRYHPLRSRSLLSRCTSTNVPFDWTVNPYRGCTMGCRYCYAAYTHEYMGLDARSAFHSVIYVKEGGEAETARRLGVAARAGALVALGTATDPWQPGEASAHVTRRFLEIASSLRGLRLAVTTKGALVLRDLDLLRRIHERSTLSVAVSLISPHADLLRRVEPWAPAPEARLEVMRRLATSGLDVGLALAPILPALTDGEADLDRLLAEVAAAGVRRVNWRLLFLRSPTRESYLAWLEREFPPHVAAYRRAFAGRSHLGGAYPLRIAARVERLRRKHGFRDEAFGRSARPRSAGATQLSLFA